MGGTNPGPHVVTADELFEGERRLYELARAGMPLAEMGVRLGLPVAEVDRRLDALVTRLGIEDRLALRQPLRQPEPPVAEANEIDDAPAPPAPPSRGISRRTLLASAGAAASLAAVGGGAFALRSRDGKEPAQPDASSSPTPNPAASSFLPSDGAGLDLIEALDGGFERGRFAKGQPVTWAHGIFFMDVHTGEIDAWRLSSQLADPNAQLVSSYRLPVPRFIEMLSQPGETRLLVDRERRLAWTYPADQLQLRDGSGTRLLFEELDPEPGRPGQPTGRFHTTDYDLKPQGSFESPAIRFGSEPLVSPDGTRVATVTAVNEQFTLRMFDLDSGEQVRELIVPLATSTTINIGWHRELVGSAEFAAQLRLPLNPGETPRTMRLRLPWNGDWPSSIPGDLDAPRSMFYSPDGRVELIQSSLRDVPASGLGGGETWPVIDVRLAEATRQRIRSATLFYGDSIPPRRWSADGSWFFTMTASEATEGPGWERVDYQIWRPDADLQTSLTLPPPTGNQWFHSTHYRGPIPHPTDPTLIALGRLEVARFFPNAIPITGDRIKDVIQANVTSESGPDHLDPWCANRDELVFALGHGGHDGGWPGAMIAPAVERPPFDSTLVFRVARAGDCLNLREAPSLDSRVSTCIPDGTELVLWEDAIGATQGGQTFERNDDGAWVAVRLADGTAGWVSSAYLDWA